MKSSAIEFHGIVVDLAHTKVEPVVDHNIHASAECTGKTSLAVASGNENAARKLR